METVLSTKERLYCEETRIGTLIYVQDNIGGTHHMYTVDEIKEMKFEDHKVFFKMFEAYYFNCNYTIKKTDAAGRELGYFEYNELCKEFEEIAEYIIFGIMR